MIETTSCEPFRMACRRLAALPMLLLPLTSAAAAAEDARESAAASLTTQIEVERQVLQSERTRYKAAAEARDAAATRLSRQMSVLDVAAAGGGADAGAEALELRLREAVAAEQQRAAASARCAEAAEQIRASLDRIRLLEQRVAQLKGRRKSVDQTLTGRWEVSYAPTGETGTFELHQEGTLVTGQYVLEIPGPPVPDGYEAVVPSKPDRTLTGSLRGTFAGGRLTLQRVDAGSGKNSTLEGFLSSGSLSGTWHNDDLAEGRTPTGSWTAVRRDE